MEPIEIEKVLKTKEVVDSIAEHKNVIETVAKDINKASESSKQEVFEENKTKLDEAERKVASAIFNAAKLPSLDETLKNPTSPPEKVSTWFNKFLENVKNKTKSLLNDQGKKSVEDAEKEINAKPKTTESVQNSIDRLADELENSANKTKIESTGITSKQYALGLLSQVILSAGGFALLLGLIAEANSGCFKFVGYDNKGEKINCAKEQDKCNCKGSKNQCNGNYPYCCDPSQPFCSAPNVDPDKAVFYAWKQMSLGEAFNKVVNDIAQITNEAEETASKLGGGILNFKSWLKWILIIGAIIVVLWLVSHFKKS